MTTQPTRRSVVPAYVIALLALFVSLGGPSYATSLITGADIKDGSVSSADITNGSLTGADIKNGSIGSIDISATARAALKGAKGDQGPSGTAGACPSGQVLGWMVASLTLSGGVPDQTVRIARCYQPGPSVMGDGILEAPEQCDDGNTLAGDGCSPLGYLEGAKALVFP